MGLDVYGIMISGVILGPLYGNLTGKPQGTGKICK